MTDSQGPDKGYQRYGLDALIKQLHLLMREVPGVRRAEDPECVHRMRVASRRLRTRLMLFEDCLPEGRARSFRKQVGRITRALGAARDVDVQIIYLNEYLQGKAEVRERAGIKRLLLRLSRQRRTLQGRVNKALDRIKDDGALTRLEDILRDSLGALALEEEPPLNRHTLHIAAKEITARLHELLGFEIYIHDPERVSELHRMRIAAKHLRYSIEAFEPRCGDVLSKPLKAAKTVQEMLGDVHDCDVWTSCLPVLLEQEKARAIDFSGNTRAVAVLKPGFDALARDRADFRGKRYQEFLAFWEKNGSIWRKLFESLAAPRPVTPEDPAHGAA